MRRPNNSKKQSTGSKASMSTNQNPRYVSSASSSRTAKSESKTNSQCSSQSVDDCNAGSSRRSGSPQQNLFIPGTVNAQGLSSCSVNRGAQSLDHESSTEEYTRQLKETLSEVTAEIAILQEELNNEEAMREDLHEQAEQAADDVVATTMRAIAVLKTREKKLYDEIKRAKRQKCCVLKSMSQTVKKNICDLYYLYNQLSRVFETETSPSNDLHCLLLDKMLSDETYKELLDKCDETLAQMPLIDGLENIEFNDVQGNLSSIASFGAVVDNNPGIIGDQRPSTSRDNSPREQSCGQLRQSSPRSREMVAVPKRIFSVRVKIYPDANGPIVPSKIIGIDGDVQDNLCRPWGVACDVDGHIIVADRSNNRIQVYKQDGSFVRRFGTCGADPGQFNRPAGVAVDLQQRIIVADKDNHRIQIFTMEGVFLLAFGEKGVRCGQFNYPWDVAVNSKCQIVVSDTRNHRIQLFTDQGTFLRKYGFETKPVLWNYLDSPRGVAFTPENDVVITDFNTHKIFIVNDKFTEVRVLRCALDGNPKVFYRPQGLTVDNAGNIIVADSKNHRIQVLDKEGKLMWKFGSYGKELTQMDRPCGIALCPDGRIAVVDFGNDRVLIF